MGLFYNEHSAESSFLLKERNIKHIQLHDSGQLLNIYEFREEIGRGNFGIVMNVREKQTGNIFAMKIINKVSAELKIENISLEIRIMKLLTHPYILKLEKVYETRRKIYLTLELCAGGSLMDFFVRHKPCSEKCVRKIMSCLVSAVAYLHLHSIAHRDIKLDNILLKTPVKDPHSDPINIKLSDFGLSIVKTGIGIDSMFHDICGTISYMCPEIFLSCSYSELCDVWSMGVILYALLLGKFPFSALSREELINKICHQKLDFSDSKLTQEAQNLLSGMLEKNPIHRITSRQALYHPWLSNKGGSLKPDENILNIMNEWREEFKVDAGEESDWIAASEIKENDIFPYNLDEDDRKKRESLLTAISSTPKKRSKNKQKKEDLYTIPP